MLSSQIVSSSDGACGGGRLTPKELDQAACEVRNVFNDRFEKRNQGPECRNDGLQDRGQELKDG